MDINSITPDIIVQAFNNCGFKLYDDGSSNIYAIRVTNEITDKFDDFEGNIWKEDDGWKGYVFMATTKPGAYQFDNNDFPTVKGVTGSALIARGQHHGVWEYVQNGHDGHSALLQVGDFTIYRITTKQYDLSTAPQMTGGGATDTERWWIDNHPVWNCPNDYVYPNISNWSFGCVVGAKPCDFNGIHIPRVMQDIPTFGNKFTLSMFDLIDIPFPS
jgi:hypothetical protein